MVKEVEQRDIRMVYPVSAMDTVRNSIWGFVLELFALCRGKARPRKIKAQLPDRYAREKRFGHR